uniref:Transposable element P transposase-like RNase H C-terminal domain-containing protein n=1 Tax=Rhipicephalus pulchellus TaxID=72859 RepID=L7M2V9_RHIPC
MLLFASRQTTESLRVTLMSVLHAHVGFQRFFGVVRSFHGNDDHPTIVQFSQIYRLPSLFTPVKNAVEGNCSGQADTALMSLHESLGEKAKAAAEIKRAVEAKLHKLFGIGASEGNSDELDEHDCEKPGTQEMVVYYLAGYTLKKVTNTVARRQYLDILTADAETLEMKGTYFSQARLTEMREFKSGCLHQPSLLLYIFIKKVEHIIRQTLDSHPVFGDLFWTILEQLEEAALPVVGCAVHFQEVPAEVIKFYVIMRLHFYPRKKNSEMLVSERVQSAIKKAKLL